MQIDFQKIYADAFDTFRVFEGLQVEKVGKPLPNSPATVWQILNHLVLWQEHLLAQLINPTSRIEFWEPDSWIYDKHPLSQLILDKAVAKFSDQNFRLKQEIKKLDASDEHITLKLVIIQQAASHLSFHVGEVVLMRRLQGEYPMPHEMKVFLKG